VLLDSILVDVVIVSDPLPDMSLATFIARAQIQNPCQPIRLLLLSDSPAERPPAEGLTLAHCPHTTGMVELAQQVQRLMGQGQLAAREREERQVCS
jgi:anaerobic magnesium-protoporphyrin IX monomethyl ester cyclase